MRKVLSTKSNHSIQNGEVKFFFLEKRVFKSEKSKFKKFAPKKKRCWREKVLE